MEEYSEDVIPAKAGIQDVRATPQSPHWIPAFGAFQKPRRIKISPNFTPPTVIPAKAGIQIRQGVTHAPWIPAFAGMTLGCGDILVRRGFWKSPFAGMTPNILFFGGDEAISSHALTRSIPLAKR